MAVHLVEWLVGYSAASLVVGKVDWSGYSTAVRLVVHLVDCSVAQMADLRVDARVGGWVDLSADYLADNWVEYSVDYWAVRLVDWLGLDQRDVWI